MSLLLLSLLLLLRYQELCREATRGYQTFSVFFSSTSLHVNLIWFGIEILLDFYNNHNTIPCSKWIAFDNWCNQFFSKGVISSVQNGSLSTINYRTYQSCNESRMRVAKDKRET